MWLRALLLRRRLEREMHEEMAEHLELATARLRSRGMPDADARRAALREFGNVAFLQEQARDARGWRWLETLAADARFACRHFAKRPVTALVMFVVLVVGMAISTLLFSALHSYATQPPMGIQRADDLVRIRGSREGAGGRESREFGEEELDGYRALTNVFVSVAGWTDERMALDAGEDPARRGLDARVTFVTVDYFSVLGARPALGAGLPADPAQTAVAVLGYVAWEQLFGKSPSVIGSTVHVNGVPVTIVGVAPERFNGVAGYTRFQLWMPLAARRLLLPGRAPGFQAVARTRPGVGLEEATAAVRVVASRAAAANYELSAVRPSTDVVPLRVFNTDPGSDQDMKVATSIVALLGLLVLLVTCANVSALLTGLATARRQEIALRLSLGADRSRIIRQLLTESGVLAVSAAAVSLALVILLLRTVTRTMPTLTVELAVDWQTAAFTIGTALAVGIVFGLAPALHATRLGLAGVLRDSAASIVAARARLQRALVVAQVGLTQPLIVLVIGVLVLVFGGQQLVTVGDYRAQQRSAPADRIITLFVPPPVPGGQPVGTEMEGATQRFRRTIDRLTERLRGTAGIEAVVPEWQAAPLGSYVVHPDDRTAVTPATAVRLDAARAAGGYFGLTGISVLRGRALEPSDTLRAGARTGDLPAVIGEDLARRLWGGADPIGRRLRPASDSATAARSLVVVGVFDDRTAETSRSGSDSQIFVPPPPGDVSATMLLRTAGPALPLVPTVQRVAQEVAPAQVVRTRTLFEIEEANRRVNRMMVGGLLAAGAAALLLSAIGLYAVVAFSVGQRGREIAVRMAFGAPGGQILRQFLRDGLRLSAIGLLLGLPVGLAALFVLTSLDPTLWPAVVLPSVAAIAALGVLLVAAAASWIPARRAAAVEPAVTLRGE